jgi:hypothetical protein
MTSNAYPPTEQSEKQPQEIRPFRRAKTRWLFLLPFFICGAAFFSSAPAQRQQSLFQTGNSHAGSGVVAHAVAAPRLNPQQQYRYQGQETPTETATATDLILTTETVTETPTATATETLVQTDTETVAPTDSETPTETETLVETPSPTTSETPTDTPIRMGAQDAPTNDDFADAVSLAPLPYSGSILTDEATTAGDDPAIDCAAGGPGQQSNTVWYSYTPEKFEALTLDTSESDYDVVIAVWRGTRGSLVNVACSEDDTLTAYLTAGTSYSIEIAQSGSTPGGGTLALAADLGPLHGLRADYFNNMDLTGSPVLTRMDPGVAFDWTGTSPAPEVNPDGFSVRWTGRVFPQYTESYTFRTYSDDGVRLWVDGQLIINHWTNHSAAWDTGEIDLQGGTEYSIRLEYYQSADQSIIQLEWGSASQTQEIIPAASLDYLDLENSTVISDETQPLADGVEVTQITVTLRDSGNTPVVGVPVYLRASGGGNKINEYAAPAGTWIFIGNSDSNGQAFGELASTVAGQKTVTAMGGGVGVGSPVPVSFVNGPMQRVSVSHATGYEGDQSNTAAYSPSISDDGRYVVFMSWATNLLDNDLNGYPDLFILDTETNDLSPAIFSSSNGQPNDISLDAKISGNGQFVVFTSFATNLSANCTDGNADIYVYQIASGPGTFYCVSLSSGGAEGNAPSSNPAISADGRYVVFSSTATNLVSGVTDGHRHIYLRDRNTNSTTVISLNSSGVVGNGDSGTPSVSANGRYVVFESSATNLLGTGGDTNGMQDIFLRDRTTATTTRISAAYNTGEQPNGPSFLPTISNDGKRVAFISDAGNLVPGVSGLTNVFLRDIPSQTTTLISVSASGGNANADSYFARISADGMHVAFSSTATNLVAESSGGIQQMYLRDLDDSLTYKISSIGGTEGNAASDVAGISSNGSRLAFLSEAGNLVAGDNNGFADVFLLERVSPVLPPPNDDFNSARSIGTVPFAAIESTVGATLEGDDPATVCSEGAPAQHFNSAWFTIQTTASTLLSVSTIGSNYDTVLAVWTGSRGSLNEVTCNDDDLGVQQSKLEFTAVAGTRYWIEVVTRDAPGGGQLVVSVEAEEASPVTVTVLTTGGAPEAGLTVQAFNGNTNTGYSGVTNAQGQVSLSVPPGDYRFRVVKNGTAFWSGTSNHCTVPGCTSAGITTTIPVTVTVLNLGGQPEVGLSVQVYSGETYAGFSATTNAQGQVTFTMPPGDYHFRTTKAGRFFWSNTANDCTIPGCTSAGITVDNIVVVTVLDTNGNPKAGLNVLAYNGSTYVGIAAYTNSQGQATLALPAGDYRFRVAENGTAFWSGTSNHCTVPGCSSALITTTIPVVVTVLNSDGNPEAGLNVKAYVGSTDAGYAAYTNAQGQATLSLPAGSYRFRVAKNGTAFWSGADNHCTIPGCTSAGITTTIATVVTVLNLDGQPQPGLTVQVFNDAAYAGYTATTDAQGQVSFTLPNGAYRFRVMKDNRFFYSGASNHCTVPGCTSAGITVDNTVLVTVLDTNGNPELGLSVRAYDGDTYVGVAATTNAQGQATLALPVGNYRFRVAKNGTAFWSGTANHCTISGCTTAGITTTVPTVITVLTTGGQPESGLTVQAYDGSTYAGYSAVTNSQGQVTYTLPVGNYHFRAVKNGTAFWSGASNHCTVPGCSSAGITTTLTVTVTVLNLGGQPEAGLSVQVFTGSTYVGYSATTNAQGQVSFTMPAGNYRFRVSKNNRFFYSGTTDHCSVPGCTTAGVTVDNTVVVTVLDTGGNPEAGINVLAYDGSTYIGIAGYTNAQGQASLALPAGNYRFRVAKNGTAFYSGTANHCTVPGCTTASITTALPVTITVLTSLGQPETGLTVQAYNGSTYVSYSATTDAQGHVTFTMPQGSYRFRAIKNGTSFWSGPSNHCTIPGCTSVSITTTIPVVVTVLNLNSQPESGLSVQVYNGSTYAGFSAVTNPQGQVTFTLPPGDYRFRAQKGNRFFYSGTTNHCTLPGCTSAGITVDNIVVVTVLDTGGNPEVGLNVMAYDGSTYAGFAAYTDSQGQASLVLPAGSYRFRVAKNGTAFWSGTTNHCTVPGCTSAGITTTVPVVVTVLNSGGLPEAGLTVQTYIDATYAGISGVTNAQGQVSFTLPTGSYRFRVYKGANSYWSGPSNHCTVPGCTAVTVNLPAGALALALFQVQHSTPPTDGIRTLQSGQPVLMCLKPKTSRG